MIDTVGSSSYCRTLKGLKSSLMSSMESRSLNFLFLSGKILLFCDPFFPIVKAAKVLRNSPVPQLSTVLRMALFLFGEKLMMSNHPI